VLSSASISGDVVFLVTRLVHFLAMGKKDKKEKKKDKDRRHRHHHKDKKRLREEEPPASLDGRHKKPKASSSNGQIPAGVPLDVVDNLEPLDHDAILNGLDSSLNESSDHHRHTDEPPSIRPRSSSASPWKLRPRQAVDTTVGFTSKKKLNAVFSGTSRAHRPSQVPKLTTLCQELLKDYLDEIECLGDVEYFLVKPVLEKCTPSQLTRIERFNFKNRRLLEDSDELWKVHCQAEFKYQRPEEGESWRSFYRRARKEQNKRLGVITKQIKKKVEEEEPIRQTVPIEAIGKNKSHPSFISIGFGSHSRKSAAETVTAASIKQAAARTRTAPNKPAKKAPLMAKALRTMKDRFRR